MRSAQLLAELAEDPPALAAQLHDETEGRDFRYLSLQVFGGGRGGGGGRAGADFESSDCVLVRVAPPAPPPASDPLAAPDGGSGERRWTAGGRRDAGQEAGPGRGVREFLGVVERWGGGSLRLKVARDLGPLRRPARPVPGPSRSESTRLLPSCLFSAAPIPSALPPVCLFSLPSVPSQSDCSPSRLSSLRAGHTARASDPSLHSALGPSRAQLPARPARGRARASAGAARVLGSRRRPARERRRGGGRRGGGAVDGAAAAEPGGGDPGVAGRAAARAEPARGGRARPPHRVRPALLILIRAACPCRSDPHRVRPAHRRALDALLAWP